ncbi:hypothetical protein IQ273_11205 [Nodosilinea sp. LEGE 07298]|nr:hypothetical protein [Nodosilinea sp. LEGE 07298]
MDAAKEARLKALTQELAELLYEETAPEDVKTLEGIENVVRGHLLERVGPELGHFLSAQAAAQREAASEVLPASSAN